jgi:hypothetical protein
VKLTHHVLMKDSVKDVKAKLWNYLTEKGLWIRNGDLKSVETSAIGWLLGAHPQLVFRPAIETELNRLVSELPLGLREEAVAIHGTPGEEDNLPPFFIHVREQGFGFGDGRVATAALTVTCVTDRARLMKELLSSVDDDESYLTCLSHTVCQRWRRRNITRKRSLKITTNRMQYKDCRCEAFLRNYSTKKWTQQIINP